jgi:hypothetical protein
MKIKDYPISHPAELAAEIATIRARTRRVAAQSLELLKSAQPDTFLGRLPSHEEKNWPSEATDGDA